MEAPAKDLQRFFHIQNRQFGGLVRIPNFFVCRFTFSPPSGTISLRQNIGTVKPVMQGERISGEV
jgi:hypothetical protein